MRVGLLLLVLGVCYLPSVHSQSAGLNEIVQKFSTYKNQTLTEKIFVHINRSFFLTGETMWFKVYYVDGVLHQPEDVSKVVYLELLNESGNSTVQTKIKIDKNGGQGVLSLPPTLKSGNYIVRAYTNWMKNFSPAYFFTQKVVVVNPFVPLERNQTNDSITYDVQFFPEGGYLVNDLMSKVAFRAIDSNGSGVEISGVVVAKQDTVASIESGKFGLGSFYLKPEKGVRYKASVKYSDNTIGQFDLPTALTSGYSIAVRDTTNNKISVVVKSNFNSNEESIILFAHTRNKVALSAIKQMETGVVQFLINKDSLLEGISHFTIFNQMLRPVCERLYFKKIKSTFDLSLTINEPGFTKRDKISLSIKSAVLRQRAQKANLSVAVYRLDSLQTYEHENITSYLKLTSDLDGSVQGTSHYLSEAVTTTEIDDLMLTHGWRRFRWYNVLSDSGNAVVDYLPEIGGHIIRGIVKHQQTGKVAPNVDVYFSIPVISQFNTSTTNEKGEFSFEVKYHGKEKVILQTAGTEFQPDLINSFSPTFSNTGIGRLTLEPKHEEELRLRSIHMQVQNAFGNEQSTSLAKRSKESSFFGEPDVTYRLDDYTRFPTMEEVLREYVPEVAVRKSKDEYNLFVVDPLINSFFVNKPLVLLDGVPIFDVNKLLKVDALQIDELKIVEQNYYFPTLSFGGILSYSTYKGDLADYVLDSLTRVIEYENLNAYREFVSPKYDDSTDKNNRSADARNLLYWNPTALTDDDGSVNLNFYTSDISGRYKIVVNGITDEGLTGHGTLIFEVTSNR